MYLPVAGIGFALQQSNLAGKVIVGVLFLGSIFAWSVMLSRMKDLRDARRQTGLFLSAFRNESHPVSLFLKRRQYDASPLHAAYVKVCTALGAALEIAGVNREDLFMGGVGGGPDGALTRDAIDRIRNAGERAASDQALRLEKYMGFLATATTAAPFLGLLGTVWGVMDAFGGMAFTTNPMLSEVAPGISGALLTTVVGLLVALPSVIGYNMLIGGIRRMCVDMDNFVEELVSGIELHYLRRE